MSTDDPAPVPDDEIETWCPYCGGGYYLGPRDGWAMHRAQVGCDCDDD